MLPFRNNGFKCNSGQENNQQGTLYSISLLSIQHVSA
jgi:hypothetical protein